LIPQSPSDLSRDWCFWNAAFYKKDNAVCEKIDWGEMYDLCIEGEDPRDYSVYTYYE
jgi:hypothetical protein